MPPAEVFPPELDRVTLFRVTPSWTLFRQSTGCSARRGLWGTLDRLTDRLRGNCGCEGRGGGGRALYTPCNHATALPWRRADLEPHSSEPFLAEFDLIL